jgi:predicted PurR-regulated permease PerM
MSDKPKNAGTIGIITGVAGAGALGIGLVAAGALAAGPAFLIFGTMFLQGFSTSLSLQSDIDSEIARQQGICDQIKFTQNNLDTMNKTLDLIKGKGKIDQDTLIQQIGDMSETVTSEINKLKSMKSDFTKKLLIQIIIYIVIVAILSIIIILKKSG